LGDLLSELGGLSEARSHYRQALSIIESTYGPRHIDAAVILNGLGKTAQAQGELAEAREFFIRALAIYQSSMDANHPAAAQIKKHLEMLPSESLSQEDTDDDYYYF
jgi:tetratricopeptide (TPR) repeat protein